MSVTLHRHTPTLAVLDGRGHGVRSIAYCRTDAAETAETRVTRNRFDPAGRLTASWDPRLFSAGLSPNQSTVYSLSATSLLTESTDAGWRLSLLGDAGQSLHRWDGRGNQSLTEYDGLMRPVALKEQALDEERLTVEVLLYAVTAPASALHNQCGRLIKHDDAAGHRQLGDYSLGGHLMSERRTFMGPNTGALESTAYTTRWTIAPQGETSTRIDACDNHQRLTYTLTGQPYEQWLMLAGQTRHSLVHRLRYAANSEPRSKRFGNGISSTYQHDPASGHLIGLTSAGSGRTPLQQLAYSYDPVGNIIQIDDKTQTPRYFSNQRSDGIRRFHYDSLSQLITASGCEQPGSGIGPELPEFTAFPVDPSVLTPYTQHYGYDASGNLIMLQHRGVNPYTRHLRVAANSNRGVWTVAALPGDVDQHFDANGNLRDLQRGQPLVWNVRNELTGARTVTREQSTNDTEDYRYDYRGQRARKIRTTRAHGITHQIDVRYLPGLELRNNSAGQENLHIIECGELRVLHWETGKPEGLANNTLRYSLNDHLGSVTLEFDTHTLISQEGFYPFGGIAWRTARSIVESHYKVLRYSGTERDCTGLYYYGLRYYAPWMARWISPDPAGDIEGLNHYRMVRNNPVSRIDPVGLTSFSALFQAFEIAGIALAREMGELFDSFLSRRSDIDYTVNFQPGEEEDRVSLSWQIDGPHIVPRVSEQAEGNDYARGFIADLSRADYSLVRGGEHIPLTSALADFDDREQEKLALFAAFIPGQTARQRLTEIAHQMHLAYPTVDALDHIKTDGDYLLTQSKTAPVEHTITLNDDGSAAVDSIVKNLLRNKESGELMPGVMWRVTSNSTIGLLQGELSHHVLGDTPNVITHTLVYTQPRANSVGAASAKSPSWLSLKRILGR